VEARVNVAVVRQRRVAPVGGQAKKGARAAAEGKGTGTRWCRRLQEEGESVATTTLLKGAEATRVRARTAMPQRPYLHCHVANIGGCVRVSRGAGSASKRW
jgi:hypothetical protein